MNNTEVPAYVEVDDDIHALMLTCNEGETVARLHGKATKLAQSTLEAMLATAFKEAAERAVLLRGCNNESRILDHRHDLGAVAHDRRIFQQPVEIVVAIS